THRKLLTQNSYSSILPSRQSEIDVLPAARLMAVNSDDVSARLQRCLRGCKHFDQLIFSRESRQSGSEDPVKINLSVLIVMDVKLNRRQIGAGGNGDLAARPDVRRVPNGAHMSARRAACAQSAGAVFPVAIVEVGPEPIIGRMIGCVAPDDAWPY